MSNEINSGPGPENQIDGQLRSVILPDRLPFDVERPLTDESLVYSGIARKICEILVNRKDVPAYIGRSPVQFLQCDYTDLAPNDFTESNQELRLTIDYAHLDDFVEPFEWGDNAEGDLLTKYYVATSIGRSLLNSFAGLKKPKRSEIDKTKLQVLPGVEQRLSVADFVDVRLWRTASAIALKAINADEEEREIIGAHLENYRDKIWKERVAVEHRKDIISYSFSEALDRKVAAPVDKGPLENQDVGLVLPMTAVDLLQLSVRLGNLGA